MDKIINKINNDIREMQINPVDEIALIGRSIYFHFRAVVKIYDFALLAKSKDRVDFERMKSRVAELGSEIKVISEYLNKMSDIHGNN